MQFHCDEVMCEWSIFLHPSVIFGSNFRVWTRALSSRDYDRVGLRSDSGFRSLVCDTSCGDGLMEWCVVSDSVDNEVWMLGVHHG